MLERSELRKRMDIKEKVIWIAVLFSTLEVSVGRRHRKNVLFLIADDFRGAPYRGQNSASPMYTPNLDKLASKSLVLKRAYVQQALCTPSRASLLTGRRPDTTHIYNANHYWRQFTGNFTTIPQHFKKHGYKSIGMGKVFHGKTASNYDDPLSWTRPFFHANWTVWEINKTISTWTAVPDFQLKSHPLSDEQLANQAITVLRDVAADAKSGHQPFFVAVGFRKPHLPWVFPASVLRQYPENSIRLPDNPYVATNFPTIAWWHNNALRKHNDIKALNYTGDINETLPDQKVLELRRAYYCAATWMDSQVGRVIDELDRLNLADDTIVSFFGDHGYQLGEHGEWTKDPNFELATHAPMMLRIPGMTDTGLITEKLTEFVDLFPTLVEAAGLPALPLCPEDSLNVSTCHEGSSFMPLIRNPNAHWKKASFSQFHRHSDGHKIMGYTLRTDRFRYTEWPEFKYEPVYKPDWNILYGVELYDHSKDPEENNNVAEQSSYAHIREELSKSLRTGWRSSLPPAASQFDIEQSQQRFIAFVFIYVFFSCFILA